VNAAPPTRLSAKTQLPGKVAHRERRARTPLPAADAASPAWPPAGSGTADMRDFPDEAARGDAAPWRGHPWGAAADTNPLASAEVGRGR
jgi:hypothetical protein